MTRSPGGTLEVTPSELAAHGCGVRVVDVREREELGEGVVPGSEHVPAPRVSTRAQDWDRDAPLVLVCRSGRRSGRVARELEALGFTRVASLTGGMLAWSGLRLPIAEPPPTSRRVATAARRRPLSAHDVRAHVTDRTRVRWTKAASLLVQGSQACVDGRDTAGVIGTPGGDAGELVLALAVAERERARALSPDEVRALFDASLDAFGRFYLHTDEHAAAHLAHEVRGHAVSVAEAEALMRNPPPALRDAVLDAVARPHNVGCGHLRLSLQDPEAYGVRPAVIEAVLQRFFERLWAGDPRLEFVMLEGSHGESGVVVVELGREVRAFTAVPLVSPRVRDTEVFVLHPGVSRFVRSQHAEFLRRAIPGLDNVDRDVFVQALDELGAEQLQQTVQRLAPGLPTYHVRFDDEGVTVEGAGPRMAAHR